MYLDSEGGLFQDLLKLVGRHGAFQPEELVQGIKLHYYVGCDALVIYIPTCPPTHPPTYLPTYLPTYVGTYVT